MNILVISDYYIPHWTGISKSLSSILHTVRKKHSVHVLTTRFEPTLPAHEIIDEVLVTRLPYALSISRAKFSPLLFFQAIPHILRANAVLINSPSIHIFPLSIVIKMLGKKLLIFHQGDLSLPASWINKLIEKVFDLFSYISFSMSDRVATFTDDYAKHSRTLKPHIKKCTSFIPVLLPITSSPNRTMVKKIQSLNKHHTALFGFAGRFVEEKGFDILLRAIPIVLRSIPDAHFLYAGDTNMGYEDFYSKVSGLYGGVKQNITELGLLNDADLKHFYRSIDCIIIPSRSDCFNLVQMEAMMQGVPSVVSNIPGARYLVTKSSFGYTFQSENYSDLAEKIISTYKNRKKLKSRYEAFRKVINPYLNEKRIIEFIG